MKTKEYNKRMNRPNGSTTIGIVDYMNKIKGNMNPSVTALTIKHILYKHNMTTFEEYIRNDYEVYVRFVLKDIDSDLVVLEVNSDYPLSEKEHLSIIRTYIRDKKIDEIIG